MRFRLPIRLADVVSGVKFFMGLEEKRVIAQMLHPQPSKWQKSLLTKSLA
jgi:hypothetical protein